MPLEGSVTRLREERESDLSLLVALRNSLDTQAWNKSLPPDYTLAMYRRRFEGREFSFDRDEGRFVIERKDSGEPVGYMGYYGLESRLGAVYGIAVAKDYWGTGTAFDAQETMLHFLFEELGLRVVRMYTHSGNPAMVGLGEKSGFRISVRRREAAFQRGQLFDELVMDLLREEFYGRHPELTDRLPKLMTIQ